MAKALEIGIIGGGLAGLTCAIHLAQKGLQITVFEKSEYPRHKVCGEYISNEVLPYLSYLGIDVRKLGSVPIDKVHISTQEGKLLSASLPLGGFGISRYVLDQYLFIQAQSHGVQFVQEEVARIIPEDDCYRITTLRDNEYEVDLAIGAYGKRSALDKNLNRSHSQQKTPWIGIKCHYKGIIEKNVVQLHNFPGGYCGISAVESNTVNLCALLHTDEFLAYKNIPDFVDKVMCRNPHVSDFISGGQMVFDRYISIAQIDFSPKLPVENHIPMIGDAAGLIHPLCGNGMAMAFQSAYLISELVLRYETKNNLNQNLRKFEKEYTARWKRKFTSRLRTGRWLQHTLLNPGLQTLAYTMAGLFPGIVPKLIEQTHGKPMLC